jgi:hypothetical protein
VDDGCRVPARERPQDLLPGCRCEASASLLRTANSPQCQEDSSGEFHRLGYVPCEIDGVHGKRQELDEYGLADHWLGRLLLRGGMTQVQQALGNSEDHWQFADGPQVLDVPEAEAIRVIRAQVRAPASAGG